MSETSSSQASGPYCYEYPRPAVTVDIILFTFYDNDLKVLLIERKHPPFEATWALPGGARDSHESAIDTAIREADEEAGIGGHELRVLSACVTHNAPSGWTYTTVIAEVDEPVRTVANGESTELRWVDITDVEHMPLHPAFGRSWPRLKDHLTTAARQQS